MRKFLISLAAVSTAFVVAAPASARAYDAPRANAYGHASNYGQVRSLQVRIDAIQRQIAMLDRRNVLGNREARSLRAQSQMVERKLHRAARFGLNRAEARDIEMRIASLERNVRLEARDRDNRPGRRRG